MNLEAGEIYGYINGTRKYYEAKDGVLSNSLLTDKLIELGMNVKNGNTRDIISMSFSFGSQDAEGEIKRLDELVMKTIKEALKNTNIKKFYKNKINAYIEQIKDSEVSDKISMLHSFKEEVINNKDKYVKMSVDELRTKLYTEGFNLTFKSYPQLLRNNSMYNKELAQELKNIKNNKDISKHDKGNKIEEFNKKLICNTETIQYKMLFRSPAKARVGSVTFVNKKLYNNIHAWMTMDITLPETKAKIVEMSAYSSLTSSTIIDKIKIPVDDILIIKDVDSFFTTMAKTVRINNKGECEVSDGETTVKNTLWDGMALIESSLLGLKGNGMALLRQQFFKACAFKANIQLFFKNYYKDEYETATVVDMFNRTHFVKNIKMITTDNAIKWLKFAELMGENPYQYWNDIIKAEDCMFGICKTDHKSKLSIDGQVVQQSSYQMVNTLPVEDKSEIEALTKQTVDYINSLKEDDFKFIDFLEQHKNKVNINQMMIDLYNHNHNFANSTLFRSLKTEVLGEYKKKVKKGKILTNADNLTICGNPYALLLHVVGEDITQGDTTLPIEEDAISCYTTKFKDGEYLCAFRSPHNAPNNIIYLHNHYSATMKKYFDFSDNIIAVNCIKTDIQDRANSMDEDSDMFYVSNSPIMKECAKKAYKEYPTIVNNIPKSNKEYNNTIEDYAKMDNALQKAKTSIGISSNLAQLAMSYFWIEDDIKTKKKLYDNVVILSVLAQVSIDNAKRVYDVDLEKEIERISKMKCMQKGKPLFWKSIKKNVKKSSIDERIECPMNYLVEYIDANVINASTDVTDNTLDFIINVEGKAKNEQMDKILSIVKDYDDFVKKYNDENEDTLDEEQEEWFEKLNIMHEDVIEKIGRLKITDKTFNRLIVRALTDNKDDFSCSKYRRKLLNILYQINPKRFLNNFKKGE